MDNWEEVRTAYKVGLLRTVTAAAKSLGVHRTTVIRHVDSLEKYLGQKLFIRDTKGYVPTSSGLEFMRVAKITDEQFKAVSGRIKRLSATVSGELIITSLDALAPLLFPAIKEFNETYNETKTVFISTDEVLKLDSGEALLALRPGPIPETENNKVLPYGILKFGIYATEEYIDLHGQPKNFEELVNHKIIGRYDHPMTTFEQWINDNIPEEQIIFRFTSPYLACQAVFNHIGIGFLPNIIVSQHPNLVEILPPSEEWQLPLNLVVHKDIYELKMVQAFLEIIDKNNIFKD